MEICNRAVEQLRQGRSIKIDWNTKSNFRTTKSLFPRLKTQPTANFSFITKPSEREQNKSGIEEKQNQLAKMLFQRHKKNYMMSKKDHEEEERIFGEKSQRFTNQSQPTIGNSQMKARDMTAMKRKYRTPNKVKTMVQVQ